MGMIKAKQLESCGALAGVWDFVVFDVDGNTHWLEFKIGKDKISAAQKKFRSALLPGGKNFFYEVRDESKFWHIFESIVERDFETLNKLIYR